MKPFRLAIKISALFAVVMAVVLFAALLNFMRVAGHRVIDELGVLRAHRGLVVARQIERLPELSAEPAAWEALAASLEVARVLRAAEAELPVAISLEPPGEPPGDRHTSHWGRMFLHDREVEIEGRLCSLFGPPSFGALVPVMLEGRQVARLLVLPPDGRPDLHSAFAHGLLWIGGLGLASIVLLALFLTAPHRRMSRAMDRIAAGELAHRVPARGRDEVAAMGRSFNRMADRIEEMLRRQKELTAAVSHELRSPLARMKLGLELLREARGEHPKIDGLEAEIDHLDDLVEELLLASRIELGSTPLSREALDLAELAREAWGRIEAEAHERGMGLSLSLGPGAEEIAADRALVLRALGNLFENAARHAREGEVRLASERREGRVLLRVEDGGPGVAEEHLPRLFEPFYRADASRSRKTGAGGLGLMIVERAAQAHGGSVRAENRPGGGLAICFDLPAATSG